MIEQLSFNIAVDITGVLSMLFMLFSYADIPTPIDKRVRRLFSLLLLMVLILFCDILLNVFLGRPDGVLVLWIASIVMDTMYCILMVLLFGYLRMELGVKKSEWMITYRVFSGCAAVMVLTTMFTPFTHLHFYIDPVTATPQSGPLCNLFPLFYLSVLLLSIRMIQSRKEVPAQKRHRLILGCVLPLVAYALQTDWPGLSLANMAALFTALSLFSGSYSEQHKVMAHKELELENARAALVLSQIQPHFLFNSMTAIMDLCSTDPEEARAALQELAGYLHYKISAMSRSFVVPFSEDMEFLQNYLKLEKRRFGERLNVEYDIRCHDFSIPLLTLQPLVENSIRHGIQKKPEGGTIRISTFEDDENYTIMIQDDGVGFNTAEERPASEGHVGLPNLQNRLAALCQGSLTVSSSPNIGTAVIIKIRKENSGGKKHEHSGRG